MTDGELGKMLPNRDLEIGQEVQKGLTDENDERRLLDLRAL